MNALTRDLVNLVNTAEENQTAKEQTSGTQFREKLHLMPPVGWLNDPNGLCQLNGIYHAFFQYSPFNAEGGVKMWGHYTSKDMIDWEYQGVKLYPDQPFDCHGVYSGSAFIEDDKMYVYYTGNGDKIHRAPGIPQSPENRTDDVIRRNKRDTDKADGQITDRPLYGFNRSRHYTDNRSYCCN